MDCYLLTLYVSLEQELAVRELFVYNGWEFNKFEGPSFGFDSKQATGSSCNAKDQPSAKVETSQNNSTIKESGITSSEQSQIFSDLQSFVEATLIAVTDSEPSKYEVTQNDIEENDMQQDNTDGTGNYKIDNKNDGTTFKGEKSTTPCTENEIDALFCEEDSNLDVVHTNKPTHSDDTNQSFDKTHRNDIHVVKNQTLSVCNNDNNDIINSNSGGRNINSSCPELVLGHDVGDSCRDNILTKGVLSMTDELNANDNLSSQQVSEFKKRKGQPSGKGKKKQIVKNNENKTVSNDTKRRGKKPKIGEFYCKECKNTFRLLGAYENHKRDGKCLFECEYCGKVFTARYYSNYKSHLKYHMKERPHKCDICGKSYIEAQTLKIHMRKHSGDRPYVCDHCGLQFYSSSHLLSHRNSAHSDTRQIHTCDICDANLSTLGNLRVHKKVVHAVERPFTCEVCGKSFKTQKSLEQVHAKVHSEYFPYKCNFSKCNKMFKRAEGLADHMRRHNNERNHFCESCGKGFYTNKDLILHTRTHTGEKPHQCQLCDYKCALSGNLRKHMKTHQVPRTTLLQ